MTYLTDDTIAAITTPLGQGGVGIVRLSGPEALAIGQRLFVPARRHRQLKPGRLHYGHVVDPDTGRRVDEVLVTYMAAPRSYTREDVLEINGHGGSVPLREILRLCLCAGARMARAGEFTLRAFLSGRLDLAQAEAVLDVVSARTDASLHLALDQLGGRLSAEVRALRVQLLGVLALLQAAADFPDEELPEGGTDSALTEAERALSRLVAESRHGAIYREGVRVAIIGRPNVGKSSLLNRLLDRERAIVTPIAGTTRDTLEEMLDIAGIPFVLTDTAGIVETSDPIERLGVERSQQALADADLTLLVVDGSVSPKSHDAWLAEQVSVRPVLLVVNKGDLGTDSAYEGFALSAPHLIVSALTGEGIPALRQALCEAVLNGETTQGPVASNPRHGELFRRALAHVRDGRRALAQGRPPELVTIDLEEAVWALGEVTGESASDDLLDTIFSNFCIGK